VSEARVRVRLGERGEGSIAPALFALVERGASRSPEAARDLGGTVELRFDEGYPPVSVAPEGPDELVVEDAGSDADPPDLVISGSLPALLELAGAPRRAGVPSVADPRGRAALATLVKGDVSVDGSKLLGRRFLALIDL